MDAAFMRKTFALIAKGLIEKEQLLQKEPTRYPYSKVLQHGVNRACFVTSNRLKDKQYGLKYGRIGARELGKGKEKACSYGGGADV